LRLLQKRKNNFDSEILYKTPIFSGFFYAYSFLPSAFFLSFACIFCCIMAFLIVGLGNIGEEYKQTRHNIGFDVIDALVEKHKAPDFVTEKYAFYTSFLSKGKKVHCIKPTTYMNLSGKAV